MLVYILMYFYSSYYSSYYSYYFVILIILLIILLIKISSSLFNVSSYEDTYKEEEEYLIQILLLKYYTNIDKKKERYTKVYPKKEVFLEILD